jgi:hypothetical protein
MESKVLTDGWVLLDNDRAFQEFSEFTDKEKRVYHFIDDHILPCRSLIRIYKKGENIVVGTLLEEWKFAKKSFYVHRRFLTAVTVTPKRVFTDSTVVHFLSKYFDLHDNHVLDKKNIRRLLTKGRDAYVPPKPKNVNYIPLTLIEHYTNDPGKMIERVKEMDISMSSLLKDMLRQAVALDKVIKAEWSDRKIRDIHNDWSEEISKIKARNCTTDPIFENIPELPEGVTFINTERECADEGFSMHHCVYSNYWDRIRYKDYIALHVEHPEGKFTVGLTTEPFYKEDEKWEKIYVFDQAFGVYNKNLTATQREYAKTLAKIVQDFYKHLI